MMQPLEWLGVSPPPLEELTVERTIIDDDGLALKVRAGGSEPMRIAQVQVDGAYWRFLQEPAGELARGQAAWLRIAYPWVEDELHEVTFVTGTGVTFGHTIEVAEATPQPSIAQLSGYGVIGLFVGVLPVALGMCLLPALQHAGTRGFQFTLSLTLGLLAFLLVDTLEAGLALGAEAASLFQGPALVWLAALAGFLALMAVGRRHHRPPEGRALAWYIALGIGLHNLGEGLAIGGAFATGAGALGTFLVIGFTLHNLTEGVAIAAPLTRQSVPAWAWGGLVVLAGLPAVLGMWLGAYAFAPHWSALFLGLGVGAILQVCVEVTDYLRRTAVMEGMSPVSGTSASGVVAGIAIMYTTAFLVQV
ncbi:hypothetical protein [Halomonas sp.]|uniref:ZIP family metal transporter n=1 Tax=Halomonas sp. TaxID=1486246 RepID=UPI00298E73D7|nr:hypothetical protein [Halomonas sp.]MDW7747319.1 hypothetical protein [Halomonas sp.]